MSTERISLPTIPHCTASWFGDNNRGIYIEMDSSWVFWDRVDYYDDEDDTILIEPDPSEIAYSRRAWFPAIKDFSTIVVVAESEVPSDQIFGKNNEETI